jgi:hypothetical protein
MPKLPKLPKLQPKPHQPFKLKLGLELLRAPLSLGLPLYLYLS